MHANPTARLARTTRLATLSCCLLLLAGCATFRGADLELDTAARQLATENLTLTTDDADAPKAQITPQGDFLVAGKPVALTPDLRAEVLDYRAQALAIARQGIAIGHQGVEVGRRAVAPLVIAALFGASDKRIEASMHKRMSGLREATLALCRQMPQLMAAQQQLASDLPAFQPYATLTQKDIDDCHDDVRDSFDVASG